ncbi:MAG: dihydrodipicolinate synthase family protein [Bacteroidia bacterium]|nr:MAG: dihydrodipicolinate synthase family protein [Bacteroidia bacterium]
MKKEIKGIIPPLTTPFGENEALDTDNLQANIRKLCEFPLAGFLVLGSNGELVMLSESECTQVLHAARAAIPKDRIMLAGTGCQSTGATIALTQQAARAGADAALVLNPSYYKGQMSKDVLVSHYHRVADASQIPVLIYNMPSNTGLDMTADTILEIASHPNIIGLKDSGGNLAKMGNITGAAGKDFRVLAGSAGFLLPALSIGASGGILALANIAPEQCCAIYDGFFTGKLEDAKAMQQRMIRANALVTRQWGVPALKAAMDMLGFYGGPCRKPLQAISQKEENILKETLQASGILPS